MTMPDLSDFQSRVIMLSLLFMFGLVPVMVTSTNVCTALNNLTNVIAETVLSGYTFMVFENVGLIGCARLCLLRKRCESFNYNPQTSECELNSNTGAVSVVLETKIGSVYSRKDSWPTRLAGFCWNMTCTESEACEANHLGSFSCKIECPDPPLMANGQILTSNVTIDVGVVLEYTCDSGFLKIGIAECLQSGNWSHFRCQEGCKNPPSIHNATLISTGDVWAVDSMLDYECGSPLVQLGKVRCLSSLGWSPMKCIQVIRTCEELQACSASYQDGHYWLVPQLYVDKPVRIYCSHMNATTPKHYVSFYEDNYVDFSDISCPFVRSDGATYDSCSTTKFEKVLLADVYKMRMSYFTSADTTFANTSSACVFIRYAIIHDCHEVCGSPNTRDFVIDTRGTGLIANPTDPWQAQNTDVVLNAPVIVTRYESNRIIHIACHQRCNSCYPTSNEIKFVYDINFDPRLEDATVPNCQA